MDSLHITQQVTGGGPSVFGIPSTTSGRVGILEIWKFQNLAKKKQAEIGQNYQKCLTKAKKNFSGSGLLFLKHACPHHQTTSASITLRRHNGWGGLPGTAAALIEFRVDAVPYGLRPQDPATNSHRDEGVWVVALTCHKTTTQAIRQRTYEPVVIYC